MGHNIHREMMRCATCKYWWSVGPEDQRRCACGGELVVVDMEAHVKSQPYVPPREVKKQ